MKSKTAPIHFESRIDTLAHFVIINLGNEMFKTLLFCIIIILLFYNGLIFTVANKGGDIDNPNIPLALKILKDVLVLAAIFLLLLSQGVLRHLKIPRYLFIYFLFSTSVTLTMFAIAIIKFDINSRLLGILKNYMIYYPASGVLALLVNRYNTEKYFFNIFRLVMFLVLSLGILLYFIISEDMLFTYSGRMISTLGNPNYLGYLSLLYIFVLFGFMYHESKISYLTACELIVAHLGLFLSLSFAAIVCYCGGLIALFMIWILKVMAKNKLLIKLVVYGIISSAIASVAVFLMKYFKGGLFSASFNTKIAPLLNKSNFLTSLDKGSFLTFIQPRISSFSTCIPELFASLKPALLGTLNKDGYVETDSAFLNLAYNFGIPVFIAWLIYFITPVLFTVSSFKKIRTSEEFNASMTFMLSIFITSSVVTHFWVQYLPEKFPTCFFIGFALSYILINAVQLKCPNKPFNNEFEIS